MGGFAINLVANFIWIYSYITLGLYMAIAAMPGFLLGRWGWRVENLLGWTLPSWAHILWGLYMSILGFFVFGLSLMVLLPVMRRIFFMYPKKGTIPLRSFKMWTWYNYNGMLFMFNTVYGRFARATTVYPVFLRAMGAKIGKRCVVNTQHVYDVDLLEIGDETVIGGNVSLLGHVGEKGTLVREPIRIGKKCTVGQFATIFPGVTMGDNCHVGAMSLVPKGARLESNAIYGGVPAKRIKKLKSGKRPSTDDVAGTVGGREEPKP